VPQVLCFFVIKEEYARHDHDYVVERGDESLVLLLLVRTDTYARVCGVPVLATGIVAAWTDTPEAY